jgi:hypothetical protein
MGYYPGMSEVSEACQPLTITVYYFSTVVEILDISLLLFFIRLHCIITIGMITDITDTIHLSARPVR